MLIISIVVNSFLEWDVVWIRFASKLITLPLIIGVGYEFIRYAGAHNNILTKILSAPGLWMQRITTQEPDLAQLEVALVALKNAIPQEFGGIDEPNYDPETKKMIKPQSEEDNTDNPTEDEAE